MIDKLIKQQLYYVIKYNKNKGYKINGAVSTMKKNQLIELIKKYKLKLPDEIPEFKTNSNKNNVIKKMSDEEQNEYVKNQLKYNAVISNNDINLQDHQFEFVKYFCLSNLKGGIAFHGTGTGKTLTAVVTSNLYLSLYPNNKVIVISPSALLYNFIDGMKQFGLNSSDKRYNFYSYDKYIRNKEVGDNSLVIIDEAHNFRSQIIAQKFENPDTGKEEVEVKKNKKGYTIKTFASDKAHKVLLLTATPFVNTLYDIENLLAMVDQREPNLQSTFYTMCASDSLIYDYMKYRISHYEKSQTSEYFPKRIEKVIPIYLEEDDMNDYNSSLNEMSKAFYSGARQLSNSFKDVDNYKIIYVVQKILENSKSKNIIYTGFNSSGVKLLTKLLNQNDISYKIISGDKNAKEKELSKKYYNYYNFDDKNIKDDTDRKYINDKFRVLIITKAGAEGVDTIATNNIFLLDPNWNEATAEQIIARAIRYKSHHTLPKNKRFVNVYRLLLVKPSDKEIIEKIQSPDFNDYEIIAKSFKEDRKKLNKLNIEKSSGKVKVKDALSIMKENELVEYKKLKTKEERQLYIQNLEFSRYKNKNNLINIFNSKIPSVDLYIFILSKSKQKIINDMIKKFDTFQSFEIETYQSSIVEKLYELYLKSKNKNISIEDDKYEFDIDKLRINLLDNQDEKINNYVNSKQFIEIQDKINNFNIKKLEKGKIKQYNQFFTSSDIVDKLINFSGILKLINIEDDIEILEPTAGFGNIVEGLLKTDIPLKIDMVEIDTENRIVLEKLVSKAPDILELHKTKDFLKFIPSKKYDYVFMNPPFHLRKNKYLLTDIYDIDFVKRAYGMLKVGGILIAITSTKYINDKWYQNHKYTYETLKLKWEGIKLNKLSKISNIEVAFIKIIKKSSDEDNELLKILDIFNDNLIIHGEELKESISSINDEIDDNPIYTE